MAEIEFLLPTVQYGNVKVRATPEELGIDGVQDAGALGVAAAVYLNLFSQGFKLGAGMDVEYDGGGTKPPAPEPILPVGADGAAEQRVHDDLKPRTVDEANAMARAVIEQELGSTTEVESGEAAYDAAYDAPNDGPEPAPWESTVDAKPKPWETGKAAPTNAVKVAEINW